MIQHVSFVLPLLRSMLCGNNFCYTVVPLLVALQVDTMKWPAYASMMLIELYEKAGTFYVRVIYNGEVLPMSFCNSETLCDFKTFSEYMKTVTPSNPALQCQV